MLEDYVYGVGYEICIFFGGLRGVYDYDVLCVVCLK